MYGGVYMESLILLGLLGLGVCVLVLISKITLKKGPDYESIFKAGGLCLAVLLVGLIFSSPSENEQALNENYAEETTGDYSEEDNSNEDEIVETTESQEQEPEDLGPEETTNNLTEDESKEEGKYIPGIVATDIKMNLEDTWNLVFSGPIRGQEMIQDSGEAIDPDTGVLLICNIFEASPFDIQWIDFIIDASPVVGLVDVDTINHVAKGYFGFSATVPYAGAEPEKAKQWVVENVSKAVKPGNVYSTEIGPVTFELFGTEYFRTLRIKPSEQ